LAVQQRVARATATGSPAARCARRTSIAIASRTRTACAASRR
jgi:hypothetical protein